MSACPPVPAVPWLLRGAIPWGQAYPGSPRAKASDGCAEQALTSDPRTRPPFIRLPCDLPHVLPDGRLAGPEQGAKAHKNAHIGRPELLDLPPRSDLGSDLASCSSRCIRPCPWAFRSIRSGRRTPGQQGFWSPLDAVAHAWKACWGQPLTSSNLVSSARLTRQTHGRYSNEYRPYCFAVAILVAVNCNHRIPSTPPTTPYRRYRRTWAGLIGT